MLLLQVVVTYYKRERAASFVCYFDWIMAWFGLKPRIQVKANQISPVNAVTPLRAYFLLRPGKNLRPKWRAWRPRQNASRRTL